ncbi:MAG: DMT family transporter [Bacteroidetes bacterium]|nr:DMT family transporter [Bacteroidota bacterium]
MKDRDKGILLFTLSLIISIVNDGISKYLSNMLSFWEISFFRLIFSTITLLPIIIYKGINSLKTKRIFLHIFRGFIFSLAIVIWNSGLSKSPLTTSTIIGFSSPIFIVLFAFIFLREKITWKISIATILGFLGIFLALNPFQYKFDYYSLLFLLSVLLFSFLDVINKKFIVKESYLTMLFYSSFSALVFIFPGTIYNWSNPNIIDFILLFFLGIGGNLLLYFMLKALYLTNITILAPFKYIELPISILISYYTFNFIPNFYTLMGVFIIIPCSLYIVYKQRE